MRRENSTDVLNPSVVLAGGNLWNFYSEFDGRAWHTALAESSDGIRWRNKRRVLSPDPRTWEGSYIAANGSAAELEGRWYYWFVAGPESRPEIGLAVGGDPANLHKMAQPVLSPGPRGSFDELAVADPYVIRIGGYWYMYYLGEGSRPQAANRVGQIVGRRGLVQVSRQPSSGHGTARRHG